jgi:hypothetical protein
MFDKKTKILMIATVFVIGVSATVYFLNNRGSGGKWLSSQEAGEKAISFINNNLLVGADMTASLVNVTESNGVYKIHIKIAEQEYDSYVTKDGKYLFPDGYDLSPDMSASGNQAAETEIQKTERPDVKLFVMSYCPYGLQAQKMFLPVYELLKDKADIGVYFVNYIMHGKQEIDENLVQYCIQKEQKDKHADYLGCFVKDGQSAECLTSSGVNMAKLQSCITATDNEYNISGLYEDQETWLSGQYPQFPVQDDLNKQYGVGGSPTLIINGQEAQLSSRSPEAFKQALCQAFETEPEECSQTLSDTVFTPGFGLEEGASTSAGGCGQ